MANFEEQKIKDLRDMMAMQAMNGLLANGNDPTVPQKIAKRSYEIADAMMEARTNGR